MVFSIIISSGMMISNEEPRYLGNSHVQWVMSTHLSFVHGYEISPEGLSCTSIVSPPCLSFCRRKDCGAFSTDHVADFEPSVKTLGILLMKTLFFFDHIYPWVLRFYPVGCYPSKLGSFRQARRMSANLCRKRASACLLGWLPQWRVCLEIYRHRQ